jgi:hypothetical protein
MSLILSRRLFLLRSTALLTITTDSSQRHGIYSYMFALKPWNYSWYYKNITIFAGPRITINFLPTHKKKTSPYSSISTASNRAEVMVCTGAKHVCDRTFKYDKCFI